MKTKRILSLLLTFVMVFSSVALLSPNTATAYTSIEYKFGDYYYGDYVLVAKGKSWEIGPVTGVYDDYVTNVDWSTSNSSVIRLNSPNSESRYCYLTATGTGYCTVNGCVESYYPLMADLRYQDNIHKYYVVNPVTSLKSSNMTMNIGETRKFNMSTVPSDNCSLFACKPTFSSSDTSVAEIDRMGYIKAKQPGKTTISVVTSNGLRTSSTLTVKTPKLKKIILDSECELLKGRSAKLSATLSPYGAAGEIKWSSNKKNVVKVDKYGNIKGKNSGKAKITARVGKIKATCLVTVHKAPKKIKFKNKLNITTEESYTFTYKLVPKKAKTEVTYTSSNPDVAYIYGDTIYGKNPGKTTVTVKTHNKLKAKCKVTVKYPEAETVKLNETELVFNIKDPDPEQLKATVNPDPFNGTLKWYSSNKSVATVDSTGYVTPKNIGKCIITAKVNSKVYAECKVEVNDDPLNVKDYISFKHVNTGNFNNIANYGEVILKDTSGLGITLLNERTVVENTKDNSYVYVNEVVAYNDDGKAYSGDHIFLNCNKKFEINNITAFTFYFIFDGVKYKARDSEYNGVTITKI